MQGKSQFQFESHEADNLQEELNHLKQTLKESENLRQSLFERSLDIIYIHDVKGRFLDANNLALNLLGYSRDELTAVNISSIICPEHLKRAKKNIRELLLAGVQKSPAIYRVRCRNGNVVWLETNTSLIYRDEKPYAVQGTARNITERMEAEDKLSQSEQLYRAIFETAGTAIIIIEDDTTIHLANSDFEQLSGYSRQELEGRMSWTKFADHRDLERMKTYHGKRRSDRSSVPRDYEFHFINRKGETRNILLNVDMIPGTSRSVASCMDITERIRAERALRKSEQNYRNIIESIQEAYYEVDLKGNFTFFNPSVCNNLGYSGDQLTGVNFRDYMSEKDAIKVLGAYHHVYVTGEPVIALEFSAKTRGGNEIPVEASVSLMKDSKNHVLGFKGVVRDITRRKEAENALRDSEERYRLLAENSSDVICILSPEGIFSYVSPSVMTFSGYSPGELLGRPFQDLLTPESAAIVNTTLAREFEKSMGERCESGRFELKLRTKDGSIKDIEVASSWILNDSGELAGIQISTRDITDRKQSEEALRSSEERFRDLASLLPETIYESDTEGTITYLNNSGQKRLGIEQNDLDKGLNILDVVLPRDFSRLSDNLARLRRGEDTGLAEYTVVRKDGSTFPALTRSALIVRNGNPIGIRGFVVDITEKKNLESLLLHAQRMESLGTLAGGIAHDFNNLMTGILGNISIMMQMDEAAPFYKRLKNMEDYVKRGSELTKQLLGFARGGKYEVRTTDIKEFIRNSTDMFARTHKEIRIHSQAPDKVWPVDVDQGQLEQVLLNLYLNAWQAMSCGGDLYVEVKNAVLTENTAKIYGILPGNYVRVTVRDTGMGMDSKTRARIFDPFFTTKERGRGTGLGLASVYGIIKNHGGSIMVESEVGVGSEFVFFLPASAREIKQDTAVNEEIKTGNGCVLLVDDEEMILDVGKDMIAGLGYQVLTAKGGTAGVEEYKKRMEGIDLVILDMIMPDLGGREVFLQLKELNPDVRVILSSGYSLDGQAKQIMEQGCTGFIQKPFSLQKLSQKICKAINAR